VTRSNDMMRDRRDLFQFYHRLVGLGNVCVHLRTSPKFPRGADYILSHIGLSRPSCMTRYHLVSEPSPLPDKR
jgi:hypothetical protein